MPSEPLATDTAGAPPHATGLHRLLSRVMDIRPAEAAIVGWAGLYIFCLMSSYYVLRPVRDTLGVEGGVENLQWLFTGTLVVMIAINPFYAALVRRFPSRLFIPVVYLFFVGNIAIFAALMHTSSHEVLVWVGRAFFIWTSVFNLFVVSVFWALMVDLFDSGQGKRLFGALSAAATVGATLGSTIAATLARIVPTAGLLTVAGALLLVAIVCVARILRLAQRVPRLDRVDVREQAVGGGILSGLTHALRSPYLLNIALYILLYILLYTITSTFLYFQQATIARDYFGNAAARTAFFASVDLAVNVLTLVAQLFLTSRVLRRFGVAAAAAFLPVLTVVGFSIFAVAPTMIVLVVFQVLRRVGNFGLAKPTRELLFTVLPREDKYKAKNVLDTVVYRLGDQAGSWSYALLGMAGLGAAGVAVAAIPVALLWVVNGIWLGRRHDTLVASQDESAADAAAPPLPVVAR